MFQIRVQDIQEEKVSVLINDESKTSDDQQVILNEEEDASFLTGNPQVRVSTGKLKFYRPEKSSFIGRDTDLNGLPIERNNLLCIITMPSHMSPIELLEFIAGFKPHILHIRILKDPSHSNCMALIEFCEQECADQFFLAYNGTYFNSIEQERCKIVYVRSIEFDSLEEKCNNFKPNTEVTKQNMELKSDIALYPPPPPGMTEIPTCAVCLDRLDPSASGVLTTLCNHTFHCECLFRWEGSNCPVCRYSHGDIGSACEVCQTTDHLWICLICGHVGCGRYSGEHAKKHYQETLHTYSLELETQRVWDYAGDGYVHRLILNKHDGKFVEVPHPNTLSGERSRLPPVTSAEQEEGEHRKLEKLAVEYNFLLKSQLEEQRVFYERRLAALHEEEHRRLVSSLEQEKRILKKSNEALEQRSKKLEEELHFVRELNQSMIENQKQWKDRIRRLEEQNATIEKETALRVADLEAQVRDLMFYLDTQSKVEHSAHKDDIQGGTIQIEQKPVSKETTSARRKSRKK